MTRRPPSRASARSTVGGAGHARARRAALTIVVGGLVGGAAVTGTLTASQLPPPRRAPPHRRSHVTLSATPYGGEPVLRPLAVVPAAPGRAAVRFVRDFAAWSAGRLAAIPPEDATARVIGLLTRAGRVPRRVPPRAAASVRIAASAHGYVVTSAVGNFLVGRIGSRWLVVSVPGD